MDAGQNNKPKALTAEQELEKQSEQEFEKVWKEFSVSWLQKLQHYLATTIFPPSVVTPSGTTNNKVKTDKNKGKEEEQEAVVAVPTSKLPAILLSGLEYGMIFILVAMVCTETTVMRANKEMTMGKGFMNKNAGFIPPPYGLYKEYFDIQGIRYFARDEPAEALNSLLDHVEASEVSGPEAFDAWHEMVDTARDKLWDAAVAPLLPVDGILQLLCCSLFYVVHLITGIFSLLKSRCWSDFNRFKQLHRRLLKFVLEAAYHFRSVELMSWDEWAEAPSLPGIEERQHNAAAGRRLEKIFYVLRLACTSMFMWQYMANWIHLEKHSKDVTIKEALRTAASTPGSKFHWKIEAIPYKNHSDVSYAWPNTYGILREDLDDLWSYHGLIALDSDYYIPGENAKHTRNTAWTWQSARLREKHVYIQLQSILHRARQYPVLKRKPYSAPLDIIGFAGQSLVHEGVVTDHRTGREINERTPHSVRWRWERSPPDAHGKQYIGHSVADPKCGYYLYRARSKKNTMNEKYVLDKFVLPYEFPVNKMLTSSFGISQMFLFSILGRKFWKRFFSKNNGRRPRGSTSSAATSENSSGVRSENNVPEPVAVHPPPKRRIK